VQCLQNGNPLETVLGRRWTGSAGRGTVACLDNTRHGNGSDCWRIVDHHAAAFYFVLNHDSVLKIENTRTKSKVSYHDIYYLRKSIDALLTVQRRGQAPSVPAQCEER
jgi:hypothetical protein